MSLQSRTPAFAKTYRPSTEAERKTEVNRRNVDRRIIWRALKNRRIAERQKQLRIAFVNRRMASE